MTEWEIVDARAFGAWVAHELERAGRAGARCLDVGAGDGLSAAELRRCGHSVVAIDPRDPAADGVLSSSIENFESGERFDAVLARLSLHHTENIGATARALRRLVRDDGVAIVLDFGWERAGESTVKFARELAAATPEADLPRWARWLREADLRAWTLKLGRFHTQVAIDAALRPWFRVTRATVVPHIAALLGRSDVVPRERAAIAAETIAALATLQVLVPRCDGANFRA